MKRRTMCVLCVCMVIPHATLAEVRHAHDASGNSTSDSLHGVSATRFDAFGRRVSYRINGKKVDHVYDAAGKRIAVSTRIIHQSATPTVTRSGNSLLQSTETHATVFSGKQRTAVYTAANLQRRLLHGLTGVLAEEQISDQGMTVLNRITDHLGSTLATLSQSGTVQTAQFTWPFGKYQLRLSVSDETCTLSGFTGQSRDVDGYDHLGARYYSSMTGRFMAIDPLAANFAPWNPYAYANDSPVRYSDPTGLSAIDDIVQAVGAELAELSADEVAERAQVLIDEYGGGRYRGQDIVEILSTPSKAGDLMNNRLLPVDMRADLLSVNDNPASRASFERDLKDWRTLMQHAMNRGFSIEDIAEATKNVTKVTHSPAQVGRFLKMGIVGAILATPDPSDALFILYGGEVGAHEAEVLAQRELRHQMSSDSGSIPLDIGVTGPSEANSLISGVPLNFGVRFPSQGVLYGFRKTYKK